jgi:LPS export ABC transporter protein LptC
MFRVIGGLLLPVLLVACAEREVPAGEAELAERPDQESWGVDVNLEMGGQPRANVIAAYVARFERTDTTFARFSGADGEPARVYVRVFDTTGAPSATVEADRITYYEEQRRFLAEGRVEVVTETGKRLEGERLTWDEAAGELRSDGFVRITTPTERIQGYRLVADETLDTYHLARITGQVEIEED